MKLAVKKKNKSIEIKIVKDKMFMFSFTILLQTLIIKSYFVIILKSFESN